MDDPQVESTYLGTGQLISHRYVMNAKVPLVRTVAVLGGSYGGSHAASVLASGLPQNWRVVLIDRNSHANHVYVFPRYCVIPGHEHKGFIAYNNLYQPKLKSPTTSNPSHPHLILHATVRALSPQSVMLSRAFPEQGIPDAKLDFDYLVYALGSHLPQPIDLWAKEGSAIYGGTKSEGVDWMKRAQTRIEQAPSVLVVGGGALGIQYATDIATAYPDKPVTLLHSRDRLLPRFDERMHTKIRSAMSDLGINVILGDRVDLLSITAAGGQEQKVRTLSGREIQAGLVLLCTGQQPNTELFRDMLPSSLINDGPKKGLLRVNRALQVQTEQDGDLTVPYPHIFAVGDTADAFGAINAGHNAARQGDLAANNILRLIRQAESQTSVQGVQKDSTCELGSYSPGPPGIKVTVGLTRAVYQRNGNVGDKHDDPLDGNAAYMWKNFGHQEPVGEEDMYA